MKASRALEEATYTQRVRPAGGKTKKKKKQGRKRPLEPSNEALITEMQSELAELMGVDPANSPYADVTLRRTASRNHVPTVPEEEEEEEGGAEAEGQADGEDEAVASMQSVLLGDDLELGPGIESLANSIGLETSSTRKTKRGGGRSTQAALATAGRGPASDPSVVPVSTNASPPSRGFVAVSQKRNHRLYSEGLWDSVDSLLPYTISLPATPIRKVRESPNRCPLA